MAQISQDDYVRDVYGFVHNVFVPAVEDGRISSKGDKTINRLAAEFERKREPNHVVACILNACMPYNIYCEFKRGCVQDVTHIVNYGPQQVNWGNLNQRR